MESKVGQVAQQARMEVALLGGFRVRTGTTEIHWPTRKGQALVAYLAFSPGKLHEREKLCALLWPESAKAQAQASLRQTLLTVKRALGPHSPSVLRVTGTAIGLDGEQVFVDVTELERHVIGDSLEALEKVCALCTGPVLDGFISGESPFDEWLAFERTRLQGLVLRALEKLTEMQTRAGRLEEATRTAAQALRVDPLQEQTHRALMRLYAMQGRRGDAQRQFESCRATMARELGIEPEEETLRLHREVLCVASVAETASPISSTIQRRLPIVGREAELGRLDDALGGSWTGAPRLVVLRGDAGVGKTRLLEEIAARSTERGGLFARGRCFESEQVLPFAPWADLVRAGGARLRGAIERELPPAARAELARILPFSLEGGDASVPASKDERVLFEAVGCLLDRMGERAPLLILLEDLQWADAMSLRLLSFVVRHRSRSSRVCFMATLRAEQAAEAAFLQTMLHEIQTEGRLVEMDVLPLSCEATHALMRSLTPSTADGSDAAIFEQVWTLSEGNPLVVVEALRDLDRAPMSPDVARLPVPLRVRRIIAEHVARLDADAQEALAAAAVIGRRFDFKLLQRARGSTDGEASRIVEELVRKRFLQASGDGFYFTHDRIREVVYESLLSPRRRTLHGAVARALEEVYATRIDDVAGAVGYHFASAGEAAASVRYLMRFAERASKNHGIQEALAALGEAGRQAQELPAPQGDAVGVAIAIGSAECLFCLGRVAEIEPILAPHRETLEQLDLPALNAPFHTLAAFAHTSLGDRRKASEHETRLLEVARRSEAAEPAGIALSQLGYDAMIAGRYQSGIEHALEAVARLDGSNDHQAAAFAWIHLAGNYMGAGECWKALDAASRAVTIGERGDVARVQSLGLMMVAILRGCAMGEIEAGLSACHRAIDLAPDPYTRWWACYAHVRICAFERLVPILSSASSAVFDPRFEASVAVVAELARTPREEQLGPWAGVARGALAEAYLAKGDAELARTEALSAVESLGTDSDPFAVAGALRALGYAELALGNLDGAAGAFERARRYAEPITPLETAGAIIGLGTVAAVRRELAAARSYFREAYGMYEALRLPFWTASIARIAAGHGVAI